MKTFKYLMPAFIAVLVYFTSCTPADTNSCDSENLSSDFNCPTNVDAVATFCSDGVNNSYYTYNGDKYECTGIEASTCDSAINAIGVKLIEAGCGSKKSASLDAMNIKLSAMAERLLLEAKNKSLCD